MVKSGVLNTIEIRVLLTVERTYSSMISIAPVFWNLI